MRSAAPARALCGSVCLVPDLPHLPLECVDDLGGAAHYVSPDVRSRVAEYAKPQRLKSSIARPIAAGLRSRSVVKVVPVALDDHLPINVSMLIDSALDVFGQFVVRFRAGDVRRLQRREGDQEVHAVRTELRLRLDRDVFVITSTAGRAQSSRSRSQRSRYSTSATQSRGSIRTASCASPVSQPGRLLRSGGWMSSS
jgi:hypothetical protein